MHLSCEKEKKIKRWFHQISPRNWAGKKINWRTMKSLDLGVGVGGVFKIGGKYVFKILENYKFLFWFVQTFEKICINVNFNLFWF